MKKSELKKVLKPIIKECIKECILEEGILSGVVSEVVRGLNTNLVKENCTTRKRIKTRVFKKSKENKTKTS